MPARILSVDRMSDHRLRMLHSSGQPTWRTPPDLYDRLATVFPFDIDLAATAETALVRLQLAADGGPLESTPVYLGPDHPTADYRDALQVAWHTVGRCGFLNPPYSLSLYKDGLDAGVDRADLQWLLIENWAEKAYEESRQGFTTIALMPYAPQTKWFRHYVMGHGRDHRLLNPQDGFFHAALDYWRLPHRVSYLRADGTGAANANVNSCVIIWGPNPGFVGPWVPSGRYWSYR